MSVIFGEMLIHIKKKRNQFKFFCMQIENVMTYEKEELTVCRFVCERNEIAAVPLNLLENFT
jgi:hypothetical protein